MNFAIVAEARVRLVVMAVALCLISAAPCRGQSTAASLSGVIVDEQGRPVPGATVRVISRSTAEGRTTHSDSSGRWTVLGLAPGRYVVGVEMTGFHPQSLADVILTVAGERTVQTTLRVAAVAEAVTVRAAAVDATRSVVGRVISTGDIDRLPVSARDFTSLALLTPGVLPSRPSDSPIGYGIASNGETTRNNQVLVDGLTLDGLQTGTPRGGLPLDAVQEFAVLTNTASAEYGEAMGAVVSVVTRSGGNETRGRGYYYHRDDRLDATPGTAKLAGLGEARIEQRTVGGTLGGPVVKNRAFYFGVFQRVETDNEVGLPSPWLPVHRPGVLPALAQPADETQAFGRFDWHASSRQQATTGVRWQREGATSQTLENLTLVAPERTFDSDAVALDASLRHTYTIGTSALNEFRLQFSGQRFELGLVSKCPGCPSETRPGLLLGVASYVPQLVDQRRWQAADAISLHGPDAAGSHLFKVGIDVSAGVNDNDVLVNRAGTYLFLVNAPYDPARPTTWPARYTRSEGASFIRVRARSWTVFAQDQWRPTGRVTVNAGVRWDGIDSPGLADDGGRVSPRLGVAVDPTGSGRTAIRGGIGRFVDGAFVQFVRVGALASQVRTIRVNNPSYVPWTPGTPYVPPTGGTIVRDTSTLVPRVLPYSNQATLGVQHAFGHQHVLSVDVVGARGRRLLMTRDQNYPTNVGALVPVRPDPSLGRVTAVESIGRSWYDALLVGLERRRQARLGYGLAYTLSSTERTTEGHAFMPQDHRFPDSERGAANGDVRHQFAGSLSAGVGWGVEVAALLTARSARPYNITTGTDDNRDTFPETDRPPGLGRNAGREDDFWQVDLRVGKVVRAGSVRIEFLAEAFNLFNHRNWTTYGGIVGQPTFGQPQGAESPRQIQLGVRVDH